MNAALISRNTLLILIASCWGFSAYPNNEAPADFADKTSAVDAVFSDFAGNHGPGCTLAVSKDSQTVLTRAYGMANLEHDIPNLTDTVLEPGSVSKQFTVAAVVMLALDGKISLDDDIRKYFPELPEYAETITIHHLIHHTSGLRDWGAIAGIHGWQRTTRIHTHKHVLDIASRQQTLNYPPGEHYAYTNTGYNLMAILVERVTGKTFEAFSQERIFVPLGMTKTQWRDDFNEVVKNRAVGYLPDEDGEWRMLMPFENVHGNGGLLTTVEDLLKFTWNLETGEVGGPAFIAEMHRQGRLNNGQVIAYAGGLFIGEHKGLREIYHAGGTAAYTGFLTRFPDQGLAVSVMCNAGHANTGDLAHAVADIFLADVLQPQEETIKLSPEALQRFVGTYRHPYQNSLVEFKIDNNSLHLVGAFSGPPVELTPVSTSRFVLGNNISVDFKTVAGGRPIPRIETVVSSPTHLLPTERHDPSPAELDSYVGQYTSREAEVNYTIALKDGGLSLVDRYGEDTPLEPAFRHAFSSPRGTILFRHDASGKVSGLSLSVSRVWDLRFERTE